MRLAVTGDNHVNWFRSPKATRAFMDSIVAEKPDAVVNLGDFGDGGLPPPRHLSDDYKDLLSRVSPTYFVLGNHDLYNKPKVSPERSMWLAMERMRWGTPLQTGWGDSETVKEHMDCAFVGAIGFPDFEHPLMKPGTKDFDAGAATIDPRFIDLSGGWVRHTRPAHDAFVKKLVKAFASEKPNIVVATHYPIFLGQYPFTTKGDLHIAAYFFNHLMGVAVLDAARANPSKQVWCFAGHAHEYCSGQFTMEAENVMVYGVTSDYGRPKFVTVDTELGFDAVLARRHW